MKKNMISGLLAAVLIFTIGFASLNVIDARAAGMGPSQGGSGQPGANILALPASALSAQESTALVFMIEEEKLARDVYAGLYTTWKLPIFQNIAAAEQNHMDELALLLTRYNLTSPVKTAGVFTDPKLQDLYNSLMVKGKTSLSAALKVGGAIEEIDILDLQTRATQSDNADILQAFTNLQNGSYNHLRAFSNTLANQSGETYAPQVMSASQYQAAQTSANGNAGARPTWGGRGQGRP
jgi:hypothetical protein